MKKLGNIGGIISGIISIVFSFVVKGMSIGNYESNLSYGGEAYTGIQNASAQAANNIKDLADIIRTGLFAFLLVLGIALICFFFTQISSAKSVSDTATVSTVSPERNDNVNEESDNKTE